MKLNVLGTEWDVEYKDPDEDSILQNGLGGYADPSASLIVIATKRKDDNVLDFKEIQRRALRHEIIHAFLYESGLGSDFSHPNYGHEETMVDWIALQFPKLQKAFEKAGCL